MSTPPPPPPPASRADHTAYTRKTRAYEPDAPELAGKRVQRARLTELERIPPEVLDIHRALLRLMPERVFETGFLDEVRRTVQQLTDLDLDLWLDTISAHPRTRLRSMIPGATFIAVVGLEPLPDKVLLELDLRFVYGVVDKLLGGRGAAVDVHRPLTDIEHGVFSFLLLKVLSLFQGQMDAAHQVAVRLEDMRNDLRGCADLLRREDHWLVASWKMNVDLDVGFARALLPVSLARRLASPAAPDTAQLTLRRLDRIRARMDRLEGLAFEGRVEAGRLEFSPEEIRSLDPGDIVVLEETGLGLDDDGMPAGAAILRFGGGRHGNIHGVAGPIEDQRVFQIERFERFEAPAVHDPQDVHGEEGNPEQVMAEYEHRPDEPGYEEADDGRVHPAEVFDEDWGLDGEDASGGEGYDDDPEDLDPQEAGAYPEEADATAEGYSDEDYDEGGGYSNPAYEEAGGYESEEPDNLAEVESLLGDMPVPVVVELGRVQLSADEVICLRPGQILELGRSPTDPVDLVVSGRLLAKGELVEIEGHLGVRILSLARGPDS